MDEQRKTLNLGLTIITLMAMIAAGSFIVKIPEVDAIDDFIFYLYPVDENNQTVYDTEAVVYNATNEMEFATFQSDGESIPIETADFNWDWEGQSIKILIHDENSMYQFTPVTMEPTTCTPEEMTVCGVMKVDTSTEKNIVSSVALINGGSQDLDIQTWLPTTGTINIGSLLETGKLTWVVVYSAHFESKKLPFQQSHEYDFTATWKIQIHHSYLIDGPYSTLVAEKQQLVIAIRNLDNSIYNEEIQAYEYDNDIHYDPSFQIQSDAHLYITGYYRITVSVNWEVDRRTDGYENFSQWISDSDSAYQNYLIQNQ